MEVAKLQIGGEAMRLVLFVIALAGCAIQQVSDDMMNNRFLEITPIAVSFSGFYSATMGPYIVTYKIASDGTGVSCYYQGGNVVVHKTKIYLRDGDAYRLIHETGVTIAIRLLGKGAYAIESYGEQYKLLPDSDLAMANLSCRTQLLQTN